MSFLGFLFLLFIGYLLSKLIFNFIIPIYKTTKQVKKGFREMHQRMNQSEQQFQQQGAQTQNQNNNGGTGEYIDFEEIKD